MVDDSLIINISVESENEIEFEYYDYDDYINSAHRNVDNEIRHFCFLFGVELVYNNNEITEIGLMPID